MLTEIERYLHDKIPLTRAMGVRVAEHTRERLVLEAPLELNGLGFSADEICITSQWFKISQPK